MPYKTPFFVSLVAFYQRHTEPINSVIITILAVFGRALYTGSERKKICADLIICSLITLIIYPRIPDKIEILKHTFAISPSEVAIAVGTPADIEMMNEIKAVSREFLKKLDFIKFVHESAPDADPQTQRWLAIARTDMQTACMAACRAVARPDNDC